MPISIDHDYMPLNTVNDKISYFNEIKNWAMEMLVSMRSLPNTGHKLTLLQQVDKAKSAKNLSEGNVASFAATVAYLTFKAIRLIDGLEPVSNVSREYTLELLKSPSLRSRLSKDPAGFEYFKKLISLNTTKNKSDILRRLAFSGH